MAISTMESAKSSNKKDEFIPEAKYREPMHTLLNAMHDKVDELITKINAIDTATIANTAKVSMAFGTSSTTALRGDTKIPTYETSSDTNIEIGNIDFAGGKYTLPIIVTQSGTDKHGNPTTLTKTATLTLT